MKRFLILATAAFSCLLFVHCTNSQTGGGSGVTEDTSSKAAVTTPKSDTVVVFVGINSKGVGRFKDVQLSTPPDVTLAGEGKKVYESKCFACHKLSKELLVGPGWLGVTQRRSPEWIMNWITNTKVMLDKDLAAQADMAVCLIRMPNQDLTDQQARNVLEFMRKNDAENK